MNQQHFIDEFNRLPQQAKQQVIDFMEFLNKKYKFTPSDKSSSRKVFTNKEFVGMWKDRDDMNDSSEWVRNVRKTEYTRVK